MVLLLGDNLLLHTLVWETRDRKLLFLPVTSLAGQEQLLGFALVAPSPTKLLFLGRKSSFLSFMSHRERF